MGQTRFGHVTFPQSRVSKVPESQFMTLSLFWDPDHILWEFLIGVILSTNSKILVGCKPFCQLGLCRWWSICNFKNVIFRVKVDCLFIFYVNREAIDCWKLEVSGELQDVPASFYRSNVSWVNILFDFVNVSSRDFQCCMIWALVYVLVYVLDGLDGSTNLHINVTVVLCKKIRAMWNHTSVVIDISS